MTNRIKFTKMHGAGNDYIYVNTLKYTIEDPESFAKKWSCYRTGIWSDGLVLIVSSSVADFSMRIFNADGSEAMMCGNASRCIGKYVFEEGLTKKTVLTLETLSGIKELFLSVQDGIVTEVTVDMGNPKLEEVTLADGSKDILVYQAVSAGNYTFKGTAVSMGNPHLVIFVDAVEEIDLAKIGPLFEYHPYFPQRVNVEFAQIISKKEVRMRVWERGSGITSACGTGACATAVAAVINQKTDREVKIVMDGGPLTIKWDSATQKVFMTGDAVKVYEGELSL